MFAWFRELLWPTPTCTAEELFGSKPRVISTDLESVALLASRFQGRVINLLEKPESECKEALISHVISQMTDREPSAALLILRQPESRAALIHLRRLADHRSVSQTWIALIGATEPTDVEITCNTLDGKRIA